jgi:hypothetical protein
MNASDGVGFAYRLAMRRGQPGAESAKRLWGRMLWNRRG